MTKFFSYSFCPKDVLTGIAILGLTCASQICYADDLDDIRQAEALLLEEEAKIAGNQPNKQVVVPTKKVIAPSTGYPKNISPQQEIASLKSQIDLQGRTNRKIKTENEILHEQLKKSQAQVKDLMKKVSKLRNELMVAETEVERLNLIARGESRSSAYNKPFSQKKVTAVNLPDPLLTEKQSQKASEEMPIATVVVDKANLRAGPGLANSPIMSVNKGTRLTVETRSGDWYRVVAPTGERAWISNDTVAFGRDSRSAPSRTVREQGNQNFDAEEDEALKLIKEGSIE